MLFSPGTAQGTVRPLLTSWWSGAPAQRELSFNTLLTDSYTAITHIFHFSKVYLLVFSVNKDVL